MKYIEFGSVVQEMFKRLLIWSSGSPPVWWNSGAVATITHPTNNFLSKYTAGFISDNNSR